MDIETTQIRSSADPSDPQPWYDLAVDQGDLVIRDDRDGVPDVDLSGKRVSIDTSDDRVIAVKMDGSVDQFVPGDGSDILRAHLAWYDSEADTITILEFAEK